MSNSTVKQEPKGQRIRYVEGVPWYPHRVRFRTTDGKRHTWIHWSPGIPWVRSEVGRYMVDRGDVKEGSVTIEMVP